ncbi:hypothetical protein [Nocardia xishanensis]|uniref:hypothetical protein n=1 Tax=Nocardia xishanensis TaxID=238964 RepID=UPI003406C915
MVRTKDRSRTSCTGAVLDELLGLAPETVEPSPDQRFAFYGRCSTEDNQDPETSYRWQRGNTEKFVAEGAIVEDYFDSANRARCHGIAAPKPPAGWRT